MGPQPPQLDQTIELLEASGSPCLLVDSNNRVIYVTRTLKDQNFGAFAGIEGTCFFEAFDVQESSREAIEELKTPGSAPMKLFLRRGEALGSWRVAPLSGGGFVVSGDLKDSGLSPEVFEGLQDFVQNSREGFLKTTMSGEILDANPRLWEMFGYTRKEFFEIENMRYLYRDPMDREQMLSDVESKSYSKDRVVAFQKKDGSILYGEISSVLITPQAGEPFLTGYIVDVTHRVTAEKAARRAQDLATRIGEATDEALFVRDLEGRYLMANRAFGELVNQPLDVILSGSTETLLPFEEGPHTEKELEIVVDRAGSITEEVEVKGPRGSSRVYQFSRSPLRNDNGQVFAVFGVIHDITDTHRLRTQMEESFGQFKAFVREIPFAVAMFGRNLKYLAFSDEWTRQFHGGSVDPATSEFFKEHPYFWSHFEDAIAACLEGHTHRADNDQYVDSEGVVHYFRWFIVPWTQDAEVQGFILTIENLDAARKLEAALERERAKSLQNSKMAALGEMASAIAHEINNPLAIIQASNDLIRQSLLKDVIPIETALSHAERVRNTVDRVSKIIRSLKNTSRDSYSEPTQEVTVGEIVEDSIFLYREKMRLQLIDLKISVDERVMKQKLYCKRVQIAQVIINLLSNAMDAVKSEESKWVELAGKSLGDFFEFRVVDSGAGIDPKLKDEIFAPFFTTKEFDHGTGLGLSISRDLVSAQGCELFLDTEAEHTSFVLRLPMGRAPITDPRIR